MGRPGAFGAREEAFAFLPTPPRERGFRIHEMGRPSPRGRRFAFAAAGAVSLAAFALSGTLPLDETAPPRNRADGAGAAVTPPSAHQTAAAASWHLGVHRMDAALRTPVGGSAMPAVGGPVAAQVPPALKPPAPLPAFRASALPVSTMLPPVVQSALSLGSPLLPAAATAKPERTATATPRPTKGGPPLVVTATGPK
ncbi:hypothetical protein [Streptomyces pactum]|nr:hypothetical protein [Streptomyces pactum]